MRDNYFTPQYLKERFLDRRKKLYTIVYLISLAMSILQCIKLLSKQGVWSISFNKYQWRRTAYRRWLWLPQIRFCFQIQSLRLTVHSVILQVKKSVFNSAVIVRYDEYHWWCQQNAKRVSHTTPKSVSVDVLPLLMSFFHSAELIKCTRQRKWHFTH